MYLALKNNLYKRLIQEPRVAHGVIALGHGRVLILPPLQDLTFRPGLRLMVAASVNNDLSLGFVLTFLLGALAINAMIYTFRNLANLRVSGGRTRPVFAGDIARFTINIENAGDSERYSIGLTQDRRHAE